jgi:HNH endonuclease
MDVLTLPDVDFLRQCFVYDPLAGTLTWRKRPLDHFDGDRRIAGWWNTKYAGTAAGFRLSLLKKHYLAHRIAWKVHTGTEPPKEIDHKNIDRSDLRWENLRSATRGQNVANRRCRRTNPLGLKGVTRHGTKFCAAVTHDGKRIYLGTFNTADAAHAAYCDAAGWLYGEFARSG